MQAGSVGSKNHSECVKVIKIESRFLVYKRTFHVIFCILAMNQWTVSTGYMTNETVTAHGRRVGRDTPREPGSGGMDHGIAAQGRGDAPGASEDAATASARGPRSAVHDAGISRVVGDLRTPPPTPTVLGEPRAESREPRAESREPRAESREPRAESREPRFYHPLGRAMPPAERIPNTRTGRLSRPGAPGGHPRGRFVLPRPRPRPRPMGARPYPRALLPRPHRPRAVPPRRAGPSSGGGSGPSAAMRGWRRWRLPASPCWPPSCSGVEARRAQTCW